MTAASKAVPAEVRDEVIVLMGGGRSPFDVAALVDLSEDVVRDIAREFGWPARTMKLKAAASAITAARRQEATPYAVEQPAEPVDEQPVEVEVSEGQPQPAAEATDDVAADRDYVAATVPGFLDPVIVIDQAPDDAAQAIVDAVAPTPAELADASRLLAAVEQLAGPDPASDRAQLVAPLVELVGPAGARVVVSEAVVDVAINRDAVLALLARADDVPALLSTTVRQRLTSRGEDLVRDLATLLPEDGGDRS